ncbi:hypothetical protein G6011_11827 [Alternaria panax]|uniref:Uncharacterized protein n=1 Tax=Alternaria panax TaxID=48097 RepID=A0AAD4F888_9PLEO|nr:hypothetical protein G6011_11827 [Alternaria panax]
MALNGKRNFLVTVNETNSVKRVVLPSSIAAIYSDRSDILGMDKKILSERYLNATSTAENSPYGFSKVVAEREMWKMYEAQEL